MKIIRESVNLPKSNLDKHFNVVTCPSESDVKSNSNSDNIVSKSKTIKSNICEICGKSYSCYPALYTHKRNKHNIIPVTGKLSIFENKLKLKKFKYKNLLTDKKNSSNISNAIKIYEDILKDLIKDKTCILYNPEMEIQTYPSLNKLKELSVLSRNEIKKILEEAKIDEALLIYIIYFAEVDSTMELLKQNIQFCILLRIYLNMVGWDHIRKYVSSNVDITYSYKGSFTEMNDCSFIPDLINSFISTFINLDGRFNKDGKLKELTFNFCNWLYINKLTDFKVIYNF